MKEVRHWLQKTNRPNGSLPHNALPCPRFALSDFAIHKATVLVADMCVRASSDPPHPVLQLLFGWSLAKPSQEFAAAPCTHSGDSARQICSQSSRLFAIFADVR